MPRLRHFKNFNWSDDNDTDERTESSGTSWLSNANIIATLSDAKIREAISALKIQISALENELLARHYKHSTTPLENEFKIGRLRQLKSGQKPRTVTKGARKTHGPKLQTITSTLYKLGLSETQSNALLAEWGKILSGGKK